MHTTNAEIQKSKVPEPVIKYFLQKPQHKVIETVFKYTALVFECHWTMLLKSPDCRMFLSHVLVNFLERELVAEILKVTESTLASYYLVRSKSKARQDRAYELKYNIVYKNTKMSLNNSTLLTQ